MTESPVVVQMRDVSKRFVIRKDKSLKEQLVNFSRSKKHKEDFYAIRDVNVDINAGSTVGLIGPNGSGKSTLLKTIAGILQPTTGEVKHRGRLAALLELGAGFHPDLTGRENVYLNASILGLSRKETDRYFADIVEFSGIEHFIDTQVKFYSSGMYVRLAFSVAVHVDPDILIIDEVLAVGDEPFQRKCMDRIKAFQQAGKTIILVSHSLGQIGELCDRTIVLEHGRVVFDGEPSEGIRVLREGFEEARLEDESSHAPETAASLSIESASLEFAGQDSGGVLGHDRKLRLNVIIKTATPIEDVIVGMGVETPLGQVVFGTNTELLNVPIPAFGDSASVSFDLADLRLGEGKYVVHATVATRSEGEVSRVSHAGDFYVRTGTRNVGVVDATVSVSVQAPS